MVAPAYIVRRLLLLVPVLLGVTFVTFSLTWVATEGDLSRGYVTEKMTDEQVAQLRELKGFDDPFAVQYARYLGRLVTGDLGVTKTAGFGERPVMEVVAERFPATLELALAGMGFAILLGIPLGTLSAVKRDQPADQVSRVLALSGVSVPIFWLALVLKMALATPAGIQALPLGGRYTTALAFEHPVLFDPGPTGMLTVDTLLAGDLVAFADVAMHLVLPAFTLGFASMAIIARMMRSSMLEVMQQDYIRTARAKGLSEGEVVRRHARRNALLPTVTIVGLAFGGLLGGAVLTETIFQWPGLGSWAVQAVSTVDTNAVLSFTVIIAFIYVLVNLIVDLLYSTLDPRVSLG